MMYNPQPIFDPATRYRIVVQGQVDVEWLRSFDDMAEIAVGEQSELKGVSVIIVRTDQAGIVGLVRRLHGLGMTILKIEIVPEI